MGNTLEIHIIKILVESFSIKGAGKLMSLFKGVKYPSLLRFKSNRVLIEYGKSCMASIFDKLNLGKQQDKQIAEEFSNEIGKLLSHNIGKEHIVIKTVDLVLAGHGIDSSFRKLIEDQLTRDYPAMNWTFKKNHR